MDSLKKNFIGLLILIGKGFDRSNLVNIRAFYLVYPKGGTLRQELSATYDRVLRRLEKREAQARGLSRKTAAQIR